AFRNHLGNLGLLALTHGLNADQFGTDRQGVFGPERRRLFRRAIRLPRVGGLLVIDFCQRLIAGATTRPHRARRLYDREWVRSTRTAHDRYAASRWLLLSRVGLHLLLHRSGFQDLVPYASNLLRQRRGRRELSFIKPDLQAIGMTSDLGAREGNVVQREHLF